MTSYLKNQAYEVLSDEDKRRAYDQSGQTHFNEGGQSGGQDFHYNDFFKNFDEAFKNHQDAHRNAHQRAHENAQRAHREHLKNHHGFHFDFDDLFNDSDFFGGIHGDMGDDLDVLGSSYFSETSKTLFTAFIVNFNKKSILKIELLIFFS